MKTIIYIFIYFFHIYVYLDRVKNSIIKIPTSYIKYYLKKGLMRLNLPYQ